MSRVIIDFEVLFDQVGRSLAGPQRRFLTQSLWTLPQQLDQAGFVGFIQTGQAPRSAGPLQGGLSTLLVLRQPSAHGRIA